MDKPSPEAGETGDGGARSLGRRSEGQLGVSSRKGPGQGWSFSETQSHPQAPRCLALGLWKEGCAGSLGGTTEGWGDWTCLRGLGSNEDTCCGQDTRKAHVCPAGGESEQRSPGELLTGIQDTRGVTMAHCPECGRVSSSLGDPEGVQPWQLVAESLLYPVLPRSPISGTQALAPHSGQQPAVLPGSFSLALAVVPATTHSCQFYSTHLSLVPDSLQTSCCLPRPGHHHPSLGTQHRLPWLPIFQSLSSKPFTTQYSQAHLLETQIRPSHFFMNRKVPIAPVSPA